MAKTRTSLKTIVGLAGFDGEMIVNGQPEWRAYPTHPAWRIKSSSSSGEYESITTAVSKKPRKTLPCTHQKLYKRGSAPFSASFKNSPGDTAFSGKTTRMYHGYDVFPNRLESFDNFLSIDTEDVRIACSEALQFFASGCVQQETLLPATLWEIPEVKRIVSLVSPTFLKKFGGRRVDKALAAAYLGYQFGIKPLIGDAMAVHSVATGLLKHIQWLRKTNGKPVRVRFSKRLPSISSTPSIPSTGSGWVFSEEHEHLFLAWATIQYDVSHLSDMELSLRILVRQLGFDKPLSVLYELMPWSFVLDWVISVGDWLNTYSPSISLRYHIIDSGHSVKKTTRGRATHYFFLNRGNSPKDYSWWEKSQYERRPGLNTSLSSLSLNDLNVRQLGLSIALAVQKL